jgi:hypothetical protein
VLAADDPIRVAFYGLAALFLAASVASVANAIAAQVGSKRPMYFARRYITHPALRAVAVLVEIAAVAMFTLLTFEAATDPTEPSRANALIYLVAFVVEIFAIVWAAARLLRPLTRR